MDIGTLIKERFNFLNCIPTFISSTPLNSVIKITPLLTLCLNCDNNNLYTVIIVYMFYIITTTLLTTVSIVKDSSVGGEVTYFVHFYCEFFVVVLGAIFSVVVVLFIPATINTVLICYKKKKSNIE